MVFFFFFFFKQKTAYEMRISDWSSDVCSSDLAGVVQVGLDQRTAVVQLIEVGCAEHLGDGATYQQVGNRAPLDRDLLVGGRAGGAVVGRADAKIEIQREIGRASCMERVCQYV